MRRKGPWFHGHPGTQSLSFFFFHIFFFGGVSHPEKKHVPQTCMITPEDAEAGE